MDHKYKALLQNIPTRHVITEIAPVAERERQIENLRNLDINNFFILGSLESIQEVLRTFLAIKLMHILCQITFVSFLLSHRIGENRVLWAEFCVARNHTTSRGSVGQCEKCNRCVSATGKRQIIRRSPWYFVHHVQSEKETYHHFRLLLWHGAAFLFGSQVNLI